MKLTRWLWYTLIGFLVLIGVGASASFYFRTPANPRFADFPLMTALHVIPGGIFLALAPFQLLPSIRRRSIQYHRSAGRVLTALAAITGITSVFIAALIPYAGWSQRIIVTPFAIFFTIAVGMGYWHIRAKRIDQHRAWMIRAFAIGLSIATQRVLFMPPLIYLIVQTGAEPERAQLEPLIFFSFTISLVAHAAFAEWWIRGQKGKIAVD